jgi:gliding motility-associated-like protein
MKNILNLLFICTTTILLSQNDCAATLIVCGNSGYQDLKVTGIGTQELSGSNTCSSEETNSLWFKLIIDTGGTLGFTLTPNSASINEDFDFFVFGPNATCGNLGQAIRCSTTNPNAASQGNNLTGMNGTETDTSEGPGQLGNSFIKWLNVSDGDTYFLVIDRPIGNSNFSIEWTGTAKFSDQPTFENATPSALNIAQCDTDNILDEISEFDLTVNTSLAIGSQNNVFATYYTSNNDALIGTNPILNPKIFQNTSNPQNIFIRLTNSITECFNTLDFSISVNSGVAINSAVNLIGCDEDNDGFYNFDLSLNNKINPDPITNKISYFDNENDAFSNNASNELSKNYSNKIAFNSETIWVRIENKFSGCYSVTSFKLEVFALPVINSTFIFKQCDEDGLADGFTDFNLNEANAYLTLGDNTLTVTYHLSLSDATSGGNSITASPFSNATQTTVFARIKNTNGCFRVATVNLLVSSTSFDENYLKIANACDNDGEIDGFRLFNLSENSNAIKAQFPTGQNLSVSYYRNLKDAQLEQNEIIQSQPYRNETAFEQTLFVRVESDDNGECFGFGPHLKLVVNPRPDFELDESVIYCLNLPPIMVSTFNPKGNYTYQWKNESGMVVGNNSFLEISAAGNYSVIATSIEGCESFSKTIKAIPSVIATISQNDITVIDDSENNSITINTSNLGIGDYEFSFNDPYRDYQNEPYFQNITPGIHTIYVRDKNSCGIAPMEISVIGYPKFFTPNNDGHNDTWNVLGVSENFFQSATVYIFNRFGKLITEIDLYSNGWNGTFNGNHLPATDYWFSVELVDIKGNTRVKKGHFSLIRR